MGEKVRASVFVSSHQNAGRNNTMETEKKKPFEDERNFKLLGTVVTIKMNSRIIIIKIKYSVCLLPYTCESFIIKSCLKTHKIIIHAENNCHLGCCTV